MNILYSLCIAFIGLIFIFYSLLDLTKLGLAKRIKERFGFVKPQDCDIWIHAASVGEVKLSCELIKELSGKKIIVSTMTSTGFVEFNKQFPKVPHFFFCIDLSIIWRRLFQRIKPKKLILLEREVWPNLIKQCAKRNIEVYLINAKFTARSFRNANKLKPILLPAFLRIKKILAQSNLDCQRLIKYGLPQNKCKVVGNIKFDIKPMKIKPFELTHPQIWVAGSTHPNEEAMLLKIHKQLLKTFPSALLIIAPRHPKRFTEVWSEISQSGLIACRFSDGAMPTTNHAVLLLDTIGDLVRFYRSGDVCFVGGSLFPGVGGHNLLEPVSLKKPVLTGKYTGDIKHTVALLGNSLLRFNTTEQGVKLLKQLFADESFAQDITETAFRALNRNQGATKQCIKEVFEPLQN